MSVILKLAQFYLTSLNQLGIYYSESNFWKYFISPFSLEMVYDNIALKLYYVAGKNTQKKSWIKA